VIDGSHLFEFAGALTIFAALAGYKAFDAFRWKDSKQGIVSVAAFSILAVAAGSMFAFASHHATFNFWGNALLGPDWECSRAPASATVCNRDLPQRLQDHPPAK